MRSPSITQHSDTTITRDDTTAVQLDNHTIVSSLLKTSHERQSHHQSLGKYFPKLRRFFIALLFLSSAGLLLPILIFEIEEPAAFTHKEVLEQTVAPNYDQSSLLCFIMLNEEDLENNRALNTMKGWGHFCTKMLFLTSSSEQHHHAKWDDFPMATVVDIGIAKEDDVSDKLGRKAWTSWKYVLEMYASRYDFVMKADLDTFMIMPHFFEYVQQYDAYSDAVYIGKRMKIRGDESRQFVAGAAVVLSHATTVLLNESFIQHEHERGHACSHDHWSGAGHADDVALAQCLKTLDILPEDTRDDQGKERFMVLNPDHMADISNNEPGRRWWYHDYSDNVWFGPKCCSEHAIAFHYVDTERVKDGKLEYVNQVWRWQ